jgi:predicted nucleotidyltransferase
MMIDSNKISEVVDRIAIKFNPDKIILFGSYASGISDDSSDLDLLIIQETDLPMHKRGLDIRLSLIGTMIPIDILVFPKTEFDEEKKKRYSFINSAIRNSKVVYERVD